MKHLFVVAAIVVVIIDTAWAQGNWPYHASGASSSYCTCYRLGVEVGTPIWSTWKQGEEFTPAKAASPYLAMGSLTAKSANSILPLGHYLGLDVDLRLADAWRLHIRAGWARDRVLAEEERMTATVDVATPEGIRSGTINQTDAHGSVDFVETSLAVEHIFNPLSDLEWSVSAGAGLRSRISELEWSWHEQIATPVTGATFAGSVGAERDQSITLNNVGRVRGGVMLSGGVRWRLGERLSLPVRLLLSYWTPRIADDETITDNTTVGSGGSSTVLLYDRDLQTPVNLVVGLSFDI